MRVTLIHNPSAGEGNSSADELMDGLANGLRYTLPVDK
jgi:hypothetical protein